MDTLINVSTFYQQILGPLLAHLNTTLCSILIFPGLVLLCGGQRIRRFSFIVNGLFLGSVIGLAIGNRLGFDPWLAAGIPALLLGAAGIFLKNTFSAITCGVGLAIPVLFVMMNFDNAFTVGHVYLATIFVVIIGGAISFATCHHLIMAATAFEGAMIIFIAILGFIHGKGDQASANYTSMYQAYAFLPLVLYLVTGLAGFLFQFFTDAGDSEGKT